MSNVAESPGTVATDDHRKRFRFAGSGIIDDDG